MRGNVNCYTPINLQIKGIIFLVVYALACKQSCPKEKRVICGMRAKTFKNKCMVKCLNREKKKENAAQILLAHKGKCISGKGKSIIKMFCNPLTKSEKFQFKIILVRNFF